MEGSRVGTLAKAAAGPAQAIEEALVAVPMQAPEEPLAAGLVEAPAVAPEEGRVAGRPHETAPGVLARLTAAAATKPIR
jgi:hypothetical protein